MGTIARNVRKYAVEKWCRKVLQKFVFTFNTWWKCPKTYKQRNSTLDGKPFLKLRVATYQDSNDFSHECLSVNQVNGTGPQNFVSHIFQLLQDGLKVKVELAGEQNHINHNGTRRVDMVGLVASAKADMSACHIQVTPNAAHQVDYLFPTLTTSRSLVFIPEKLPLAEDVFVETFSGNLWACFFAAFVLLILCFRLSTWAHSKLQPNHEPWSWIEVILWAIAAVCQQSYSRYPKGLSCRTTFIIGYLITYLLYTGFAAGVTSLLAVQSKDLDLDLDDVIEMKLTIVTVRNTQNPSLQGSLFVSQGLKHREKLKRIHTQVVKNNADLFKKLNSENFIGYGSTPTLEHHLAKANLGKRKYYISRLNYPRFRESLIIRQDFPFKHAINIWLIKMMECGLLDFGQQRYIKGNRDTCCDEPAWSSASLHNVYSAVFLLTFGQLLAVLILFAEMAWMNKITGTKWEQKAKEDVLLRCRKPNHSKKAYKQ